MHCLADSGVVAESGGWAAVAAVRAARVSSGGDDASVTATGESVGEEIEPIADAAVSSPGRGRSFPPRALLEKQLPSSAALATAEEVVAAEVLAAAAVLEEATPQTPAAEEAQAGFVETYGML